jgi:hypothetical protein
MRRGARDRREAVFDDPKWPTSPRAPRSLARQRAERTVRARAVANATRSSEPRRYRGAATPLGAALTARVTDRCARAREGESAVTEEC